MNEQCFARLNSTILFAVVSVSAILSLGWRNDSVAAPRGKPPPPSDSPASYPPARALRVTLIPQ